MDCFFSNNLFKYSVNQCIMKNVIVSFHIGLFKYSVNQCIMKNVIVSFQIVFLNIQSINVY